MHKNAVLVISETVGIVAAEKSELAGAKKPNSGK
jgi:hypothetical protein